MMECRCPSHGLLQAELVPTWVNCVAVVDGNWSTDGLPDWQTEQLTYLLVICMAVMAAATLKLSCGQRAIAAPFKVCNTMTDMVCWNSANDPRLTLKSDYQVIAKGTEQLDARGLLASTCPLVDCRLQARLCAGLQVVSSCQVLLQLP